ncbi:MAG: hypothetical protein ACMXX8_03175 [Candidatus Woesearchaeota archaeon]
MKKNFLGVVLAMAFLVIGGAIFVSAQLGNGNEELPVEELSEEPTNVNSYNQGFCNGNCPYKENGCNGACGGSCGVRTCGCGA